MSRRKSLPEGASIVTPKRAPSGHPLVGAVDGRTGVPLCAGVVAQHVGAPAEQSRWLDLAAMSTVADVVPLVGENRWIVHQGLRALESTERPGLQALLEARRSRGVR